MRYLCRGFSNSFVGKGAAIVRLGKLTSQKEGCYITKLDVVDLRENKQNTFQMSDRLLDMVSKIARPEILILRVIDASAIIKH